MPQATTIRQGHESQAKSALGILVATVTVIASLLMITVLSNGQPTVEVPDTAAAPAAPLAAAASPGTGVPEATAVFAGKDVSMEEPAPTF